MFITSSSFVMPNREFIVRRTELWRICQLFVQTDYCSYQFLSTLRIKPSERSFLEVFFLTRVISGCHIDRITVIVSPDIYFVLIPILSATSFAPIDRFFGSTTQRVLLVGIGLSLSHRLRPSPNTAAPNPGCATPFSLLKLWGGGYVDSWLSGIGFK